jgi:hypothetical protein
MNEVDAHAADRATSAHTIHTAVLDKAHLGDIHGALGGIAEDDFVPRSTLGARLKTLLAILGQGSSSWSATMTPAPSDALPIAPYPGFGGQPRLNPARDGVAWHCITNPGGPAAFMPSGSPSAALAPPDNSNV